MLNSIKLGFIVLLTLFTSLNVQAAGDCIRRHACYLSLGGETDFSGNQ